MVIGRVNFCAHFAQRFHDALHRPPRQRFIANHFAEERLRCNNARQHAHGRAGVAAIKLSQGGLELRSDAVDYNRAFVVPLDVAAKGTNTAESAGAVGARRVVFET